jgi:FixJ family two-component response regulator
MGINTGPIGILDDEPQMRTALVRLLASHDLATITYAHGEDLLESVASGHPPLSCLLLDMHMGGLAGFEILEALAAARSPLPVIVITGHDEPANTQRIRDLGAIAYLQKPLDESVLLAAIHRARTGGSPR